MLVGETVKTRKGQKTVRYSNGTKAQIIAATNNMLLRIYHWHLDAIREEELLKRVGVAPENIITRKSATFVTIQDAKTGMVAQHIEAIPEAQGGSGYIVIIEVRGVSPEQFKTILDAEKDMESLCASIVSFRIRGRMKSDSDVLVTVIECRKGDIDYLLPETVKENIAEAQGVPVDDVELCGVWGEKEKKEAVTQ